MKLLEVFLRHRQLKYYSEKSTAKSSAFENYISSANLSFSGFSSAEPNSDSVGKCKVHMKKTIFTICLNVDH